MRERNKYQNWSVSWMEVVNTIEFVTRICRTHYFEQEAAAEYILVKKEKIPKKTWNFWHQIRWSKSLSGNVVENFFMAFELSC